MDQADHELAERIAAADVRYIKLGAKGAWEAQALDHGTLEWGDDNDPHALALALNWDDARTHYSGLKASAASTTSSLNELRTFYGDDRDLLWITFARGSLWWGFAEPGVMIRDDVPAGAARCFRRIEGGWCNVDLKGRVLSQHDLSSALTKVTGYMRSICAVEAKDYLLRKLLGAEEPVVVRIEQARAALIDSVAERVAQLHWADFEILVDLIFVNGGWRRISERGGTMKDIDLLLHHPAIDERASVQIKSRADQKTLEACVAAFSATNVPRFYFVCHSPSGRFEAPIIADRTVITWTAREIAQAAIDNGMTDWLIARAA